MPEVDVPLEPDSPGGRDALENRLRLRGAVVVQVEDHEIVQVIHPGRLVP